MSEVTKASLYFGLIRLKHFSASTRSRKLPARKRKYGSAYVK